jgi:hypothetical protein
MESPPEQILAGLREIAAGQGLARIAREVEDLQRRNREGRFFLAVVGQFKRGKSTLINALLGTPLLPTGVVPVTAVVTIVEHGAEPRARVEKIDGNEEIVPLASIREFICMFVLNKVGLVEEADRLEAATFSARVIGERLGRPAPPILSVSARLALEGGDEQASNLRIVRDRISELAASAGADIVRKALERGVRRLGADLTSVLHLQRRALLEPLEDLQSRIEAFERESLHIRRALEDLEHLLRGGADGIARWLNSEAQRFLQVDESIRSFHFELRDRLEQTELCARDALERAARLKTGGQTAVAAELAALERAIMQVRALAPCAV